MVKDINLLSKEKIRKAGEKQGWWDSEGLVVALSGGADSVCMLLLLKNFYKGRLVAAHLDHTTRNGQSYEDACFVVELCKNWEIDCHVKRLKVNEEKLIGESFEMAARRERYAFFNEVVEKEKLFYIALGHSADDVVETQLMNLFRGTGLLGLRGIPSVNKNIVRPIISFRRNELRQILSYNNISWREDSSNKDSRYLRNRVRNELVPWIQNNINKNFQSVMLGLAQQVEAELTERFKHAAFLLDKVTFSLSPSLVAWHSNKVKRVSKEELAEMLRMQGDRLNLPTLSRKRTEDLLLLFNKGGFWRFQWARDIEVCYSERGIGWLHRKDVEKALDINKKMRKNETLPWWAR